MKKKLVLLIEDKVSDVEMIKESILKSGIECTLYVTEDAEKGLNALTGNTEDGTRILPDIILVDITLPKMSGFEFLRIIRSYYSLKEIKTFVIAPTVEEYDKVIAKNLGAYGYIQKPINFKTPSGDIKNLLDMLKN